MPNLWDRLRRFYRILLPIRFSVITVALLAFALVGSDQGHDAIAALAEGNATLTKYGNTVVRAGFLILVPLLALQTWYWSRVFLRIRFPEQPDPNEFPWAVTWAPRILGLAAFATVITSLLMVRARYGENIPGPRAALLRMALIVLLEAILFVVGVILRRRWLEKQDESATDQKEGITSFGPSTQSVLHTTSVLAVVVLLGSIFAVQQLSRIGSMSILVLTMGLWVSLGGVVVYWGMKLRIPILTWLLLFAIIISPLADNHRIRTIGPVPPRPTTAQLFDAWYTRLEAQYPNEARRPVFIVATEGGGIRAAYWTAAVLTSLSDTLDGFSDHLFAVSSVSGGSLGAATHRALLADGVRPSRPKARASLAYDALAPTLAAMTQQDFVQRFIPACVLPDRAQALEGGWERGWEFASYRNPRFTRGFLATTTVDAHRLPSMFFNGTSVETGERILTSNARIDATFADATDFFEVVGGDVKMSTGVDNSTRFPYVSPAGTMRAGDVTRMHIVDGGYFENSGAVTAAELLRVIQQHPKAASIRPYVIFIRYQGLPQPLKPKKFANEVLSPVRTILATRDARGQVAVTQLARAAEHTSFTLVQRPNEVPFPLGWLLAARTRDLIDRQMGPRSTQNGPNVHAVARALGVTPREDVVWNEAVRSDNAARAEERQ